MTNDNRVTDIHQLPILMDADDVSRLLDVSTKYVRTQAGVPGSGVPAAIRIGTGRYRWRRADFGSLLGISA
jgi:hypothetical protein